MNKKQIIKEAIRDNQKSGVEIAVVWDKVSADDWETEFYTYLPIYAADTLCKYGWIVGLVKDGTYLTLDKPEPISENSKMFPITE